MNNNNRKKTWCFERKTHTHNLSEVDCKILTAKVLCGVCTILEEKVKKLLEKKHTKLKRRIEVVAEVEVKEEK